MQMPDVVTRRRDTPRGNVFEVYAYRELTDLEVAQQVRSFYSMKKNARYLKKGKKERVVQIFTVYA